MKNLPTCSEDFDDFGVILVRVPQIKEELVVDREQRNLQQKNGANRTQVVHDPPELFTM